jgi:hypothetical protein
MKKMLMAAAVLAIIGANPPKAQADEFSTLYAAEQRWNAAQERLDAEIALVNGQLAADEGQCQILPTPEQRWACLKAARQVSVQGAHAAWNTFCASVRGLPYYTADYRPGGLCDPHRKMKFEE